MDIERTYDLSLPRKVVFDAWISEETVIAPAARMQVDPVVGGIYCLVMPDGSRMVGRFSEFQPSARVGYSWQWEGSSEVTSVDVTFSDLGGGGCRVFIAHRGFESVESRDRHASGWDAYISGLKNHLVARG